jgi:hypothetical protein
MAPAGMTSLAAAIDEVAAAHFCAEPIAAARRRELARWIAGRQGQPRGYAGLPAPTEAEFSRPPRTFTGEAIRSGAATAHVLGEEACRALILLDQHDAEVVAALARAGAGMRERLSAARCREAAAGREWYGEYCCGTCSVALWRHLAAGGIPEVRPEAWLAAAARGLQRLRLGDGRWRRFPFYYTLLALTEMPAALALAELRYAAPACERLLRRDRAATGPYAQRRRLLLERALVTAG